MRWDLEDDEDGKRLILSGSGFQTAGAWYWNDGAQALFGLTRGTGRSFWEEERRGLEGEYEDRQQQRYGDRVTAKYRNERVAIQKLNSFCYRKPFVFCFPEELWHRHDPQWTVKSRQVHPRVILTMHHSWSTDLPFPNRRDGSNSPYYFRAPNCAKSLYA